MTIPYNVSIIQAIRYLKESFLYADNFEPIEHISNLENNNIEENTTLNYDQWLYYNKNKEIKLKSEDFTE